MGMCNRCTGKNKVRKFFILIAQSALFESAVESCSRETDGEVAPVVATERAGISMGTRSKQKKAEGKEMISCAKNRLVAARRAGFDENESGDVT